MFYNNLTYSNLNTLIHLTYLKSLELNVFIVYLDILSLKYYLYTLLLKG